MSNELSDILLQLQQFRQRYYLNQIVRGFILFLSLALCVVILVALLEHFNRYSPHVRTVLFFSVLTLYAGIFSYYILMPLFRLWGLAKGMDYREASEVINRFFPEISDRLINVIELGRMSPEDSSSLELLQAGIRQKADFLRPFRLPRAVRFRSSARYLRYLLPVVGLFFLLWVFVPAVIRGSTDRIIHHNKEFLPEAPFTFELVNTSLELLRGGDLEINLRMSGSYLPAEASIVVGGNSFYMDRRSRNSFTYLLRNVNNPVRFHFEADGFSSQTYELKLLDAPAVLEYFVEVTPPPYTGEKSYIQRNSGDLLVPAGTSLRWVFSTSHVSAMMLLFSDSTTIVMAQDENSFSASRKLYESVLYSVGAGNSTVILDQLMRFTLDVVPDYYPEISVSSVVDSLSPGVVYFGGRMSDDYGFSRLAFCYSVGKSDSVERVPVRFAPFQSNQEFYFTFSFTGLNLSAGDDVTYYFSVWDNDAVHGPKSTSTAHAVFNMPDAAELDSMTNSAYEKMQQKFDESNKLLQDIQNDLKTLKNDQVARNMSDWEKMNLLQNIADKQLRLDELLQDVEQENLRKNTMLENFSNQNQEILEKQELLEEMLNSLMDEEMRKMLEEIRQLENKLDPKEMQKLTDMMELNYNDLDKDLERSIEMMKRFEVEQKMDAMANELKQLADDQQKLGENVEDANNSDDQMSEQSRIEEDFERQKEQYNDIQELNQQLERPMNLDNFDSDFAEIQELMDKAQQELSEGKQAKSSKSMKNAAQKMDELSEKMNAMMNSATMEQDAENIDDLRNLMDNILKFSFAQEALITQYKSTLPGDPEFRSLVVAQKNLGDDFQVIRDSLFELSKRIVQLDAAVSNEVSAITFNQRKALEEMNNRRNRGYLVNQQNVVTSANNLNLLLSEVTESLMQQMANAQGKPSSGKGRGRQQAFGDMKGSQESFKKQLQEYLNELKNQSEGSGKQPGQSQRLAKMLAQQEIMQKMLEDLMNGSEVGSDTRKQLSEIKKMIEENQRDIINRNITPDMLNRQQNILTRMLEAERSENQREVEKKRQSEEGKVIKKSNPEDFFKYKENNRNFTEEIQYNSIRLNNYYKNLYKEYLDRVNP